MVLEDVTELYVALLYSHTCTSSASLRFRKVTTVVRIPSYPESCSTVTIFAW